MRRLLLLIVLACLWAARLDAATAFVAHSGTTTGSTTTLTVTGVNASAGNFVVVTAGIRTNGGHTITGVTFNGSATGWGTFVRDSGDQANGTRIAARGAAGLTGTQDIVVTLTSG